MCGIAGIFELDGRAAPRPIVERMVETLHHRGPDDRGFHHAGRLSMGMRRLSIIDVAGGQQPLSSEDGQVTVVCNGEIYNHQELRRELQAGGHVFKTRSDIEVIVHLYEEHGDGFIERLRGMFAIALWDERRQRLILGRDRLGIKPLFYAVEDGRVLFGSEIKALVGSGVLNRHLDPHALDRYLTCGYIPAPLSIYREIKKLEPGHVMICEQARVRTERYWQLRFEPQPDPDEAALSRRFLELFADAVRTHLMSDVSLGAFLSGGVDSSLVVALMSECTSAPVKTFTIGFGGTVGGYLDERPYARLVSQRYGTDHTEFEVLPKIEEVLDEAVEAFDEPFADDSVIPTAYICKLARSEVTVALTGLGGDELFGGYERHLGLKLSAHYDRVPAFVRNGLVAPVVNRLPERRDGHYTVNHLKRFVRSAGLSPARRYLDYTTVFSDALKRAVCRPGSLNGSAGAVDTEYFDTPFASNLVDRALYHDIHTYLPEDILALSDRLSMQHGLELRVPFLDHPLVEFCATIPSSMKIQSLTKKYLLKKLARPLLPGVGPGSPQAGIRLADERVAAGRLEGVCLRHAVAKASGAARLVQRAGGAGADRCAYGSPGIARPAAVCPGHVSEVVRKVHVRQAPVNIWNSAHQSPLAVASAPLRRLADNVFLRRDGLGGWTPHRNELRSLMSSSPEDIARQALHKLRDMLMHAYTTVPYYREKWTAIGFEPSPHTTLDDLRRLPLLPKADIRERKEDIVSAECPTDRPPARLHGRHDRHTDGVLSESGVHRRQVRAAAGNSRAVRLPTGRSERHAVGCAPRPSESRRASVPEAPAATVRLRGRDQMLYGHGPGGYAGVPRAPA